MRDFDATFEVIRTVAGEMKDLQQRAEKQYRPAVEEILRTRCRDTGHIDHTLDGLLDFCGHEPVLRMYKNLCRYYWDIDPAAAADYINAYREHWDSDEPGAQP